MFSATALSAKCDGTSLPQNDPTPGAIVDLIERCQQAKEYSYNRYSNFRVGAALLCQDGTIYTGCNVENASYGLTICAERTAIFKAVSEGHRKFTAIAISSDVVHEFISPCGACRQVFVEFGVDWDVFMTKPDLTYKRMKTGELLPFCFAPESFEQHRVLLPCFGCVNDTSCVFKKTKK
ncbi:hypothetical protein DPMN_005148 [Dreissena polymorpha]|uniref:Cytidine deaminase n=1 Tax=Dreissena polymorpha TaxID=45954 RepID=A0A9D4MPT5_DREPO|nr:hypothetical protein DPMN_005148 [Dreissena polymorpha]